jgi:hypothetical protein
MSLGYILLMIVIMILHIGIANGVKQSDILGMPNQGALRYSSKILFERTYTLNKPSSFYFSK